MVVLAGPALAACAPLLSYDDLGLAPDAGADAARADAGDLCRFAPVPDEGFYCGPALSDAGSPRDLWECVDGTKAPGSPAPCALGCVVMPAAHADLCSRCDLGDGTYCVKEWKPDYLSVDDVLLTCEAGVATTSSCSANCVHDAPRSRCP